MPRPRILALLLLLLPAACATGADPGDPLEPVNRRVLAANLVMDDAAIRPAAAAYRDNVPAPVRAGVRNALVNLRQPRILANQLLQLRLEDAGHTLMRFFLNSTVGLGGLIDVAGPAGITPRTGDFGQTLDAWGLPSGPYLVLPLLGPSNPRDALGAAADLVGDPFTWLLPWEATVGRLGLDGIEQRAANIEGLDELRRGSLDFYSRLRSVWRQAREAELGRSVAAAAPSLADPGLADPGLADPGPADHRQVAPAAAGPPRPAATAP